MFSEQDFISGAVEGANATQFRNIPPNIYPAIIKEVKARQSVGKKDTTKTYTWLDLTLDVQLDPTAKEALKRETAQARYSISLDLTEAGGIDMSEGANVNLGRLRKALGQNDASRPWRPADMTGQMLNVEFGPPRVDGDRTFDEIKSVSAFT